MANKIKISELIPKGAPLSETDLFMIAEATTDGFDSKSITGAEIITSAQEGRQATLVSGTNIKTLEGQSLLGSGNIDLTKSDVGLSNVDNTSDLDKPISTATQTALNAKQDTLVSGTNIKTINGNSLLGSGDLTISGGGGLTIGTTAITSGTIGRVLFQGTGNVLQQSTNLFWDNTNGRFGINTALPNMALDIRTGNVGIGVTSDAGFKLDVNGTARVQNAFTANGKIFAYGNSTTGLSGLGAGLVVEYNSGRGRLFSYDYGAGVSSPISIGENSSIVYIGAYNAAYTSSINIIGSTTIDGDINFIKSTGNILHQYNIGGSIKFILGINSTLNGYQIFNNTTNNRPIFLPQVSGNVIINGTTDITSAQLQITSTTKGFLPPRMTTTQKNAIASPASGLIVYDTTLNKLCVYTTTWETITSA